MVDGCIKSLLFLITHTVLFIVYILLCVKALNQGPALEQQEGCTKFGGTSPSTVLTQEEISEFLPSKLPQVGFEPGTFGMLDMNLRNRLSPLRHHRSLSQWESV